MIALYAIGKPGEAVRIYLSEPDPTNVRAQLLAGEVAVLVNQAQTGMRIATNGGSAQARTAVTLAPITTAVQLATPVPVPAGVTWTAIGKGYIGPQSLLFGAAGVYSAEMTGGWTGSTVITTLSAADYQAWLLDRVDDEAERRKMLVLTSGGAKKMEYDAKRAEVEAYYSLGGTVAAIAAALLVLSTETRQRRFRYGYAEARITGEPIGSVMARFRDGSDAYQAESARLAGIVQQAKRAIKAATSSAAKLAVVTSINWSA